ncbi:MAG: methylmalonyl-CoA epimerase [Flavobacteriales bacterium]|jgi:methylmalonyl-CoA/ethylmalonyl-CoA epimerase|nr:methylmalonyl-CoA epimerase [Flavobacteriales bacterium]|tara:strand:- start:4506 stop:4904 length:399 start_codon:yes stop_codon:yes gene_type:complete
MDKIEHIGIAVKDITEANAIFKSILGKTNYKTEYVDSEDVLTSFFDLGESKIELIESSHKNHTISKFLNNNNSAIHHIAIKVSDIYFEIKRIRKEGIRVLNEIPKEGADNKLICFLHPKDTLGVLIELCQEK